MGCAFNRQLKHFTALKIRNSNIEARNKSKYLNGQNSKRKVISFIFDSLKVFNHGLEN